MSAFIRVGALDGESFSLTWMIFSLDVGINHQHLDDVDENQPQT